MNVQGVATDNTIQAYHLSVRGRNILNGLCCCNRCPHVLHGGHSQLQMVSLDNFGIVKIHNDAIGLVDILMP